MPDLPARLHQGTAPRALAPALAGLALSAGRPDSRKGCGSERCLATYRALEVGLAAKWAHLPHNMRQTWANGPRIERRGSICRSLPHLARNQADGPRLWGSDHTAPSGRLSGLLIGARPHSRTTKRAGEADEGPCPFTSPACHGCGVSCSWPQRHSPAAQVPPLRQRRRAPQRQRSWPAPRPSRQQPPQRRAQRRRPRQRRHLVLLGSRARPQRRPQPRSSCCVRAPAR